MADLVSVTTRLNKESVQYVNSVSKLFKIDKSTALRNILQKGVHEDKKMRALDLYLNGKFSIEKAAKFAGMYMGEFLDLMREKGIESNVTLDDFEESLKHSKKVKM